jgi:hypothetical protein
VASKQLIIKDLKTEKLGFENLTTAERDLILNPEAGTTIFNSDTNSINYYDGTNWLIAGGLNVIPVSGSISGVSGSHYLADTSGGAFTITLPAGSIGARLKFSDASETWNEFPLTIAPAAGEAIDGYSVDETLVCDVLRGWVDLTWDNTNSKWILDSFIGTNAWQTQVHTTIALANDNTSIVQNFSLYDAQELIGHVSVDADTDYRASVRVIVVKNGAGTYEVSLAEVSGDSINASPIVAFSMSGADLQATLPDFTGFVSANIKYYLVRPITTADYPLSIDGSQITSGTVSPDRIPLATGSTQGAVSRYQSTTITADFPGASGNTTIKLTRIGDIVTITTPAGLNYTSATTTLSSSGLIPVGYRPAHEILVLGACNTAIVWRWQVTAAGQIGISTFNWSGTATAQGSAGSGMSITYQV